MRLQPFVLAAVTIGLLAGCGDDRGAGAGPVAGDPVSTGSPPAGGPSDQPAGDWTASPGQLDKATAALTSRRLACSDLRAERFTWRACAGRSGETVKVVAAEDGTVVQVAIDGEDELLRAVGPHVFGDGDTAILIAEGTRIQWGTVRELEVDGYQKVLVGAIAGLQQPPAPPSGPLQVTKEQALLALTKVPSWDCRIDDGMSTPEPKELGQVDVGPTLDCHDKTLAGDSTTRSAGVELADDGSGIDDLEMTASHPSRPPAPGVLLTTKLEPVWAALGPDLGEVRQAVERYLSAGVETTGYAAGWKIIVRHGTVPDSDDSTKVAGHSVRVRILRERPDLADPKATE